MLMLAWIFDLVMLFKLGFALDFIFWIWDFDFFWDVCFLMWDCGFDFEFEFCFGMLIRGLGF